MHTPSLVVAVVVAAGVLAPSPRAHAQEERVLPPSAEEGTGRVRAGFDLEAGYGVGGGATGGVFTTSVQLGWQIDDRAAIYLQGSVVGWASSSRPDYMGDSSGAVGVRATPVIAWHLARLFELAGGPSMDPLNTTQKSIAISESTRSSGGSSVGYHAFYPGADVRLTLHVPVPVDPPVTHRKSVPLFFAVHSTLAHGDLLTFATLGTGFDWY